MARTDITSNSITKNYLKKLAVDHLLIDFNSIVHVGSQNVVSEVNGFMRVVLKNLYLGHSVSSVKFTELFTKYKMTAIQSKIKPGVDPNFVIDLFRDHFDDKYMDKLVIGKVIGAVLHILKTYCIDKRIKTMYIAIDGVPSKGKLVEQRQRRYMGSVTEKYKEKILESYKEYLLKQPDNIYLMEKFQIKWSKGKISPGTNFLYRLTAYLNSEPIQSKFLLGRKKLKIVVSSFDEIGEGEAKIMRYIEAYIPPTEPICIYSPDADMILLSMLSPSKTIYYLQFHQQELWYNVINIATLKQNIVFYVNNHPKYSKGKFDTDRVNYDIVYLSTLFGNDFVPKIETINVKSGFLSIMDAYLETLMEFKDKKYYLVKTPTDTNTEFSVNFTFLKSILHKLLPIEDDFIKHNDLYNRYIKIGLIKSVFDYMEISSENLVSTLNEFRTEYENLKHAIKNNQSLHHYESHDELMNSLKKCIQIKVDGQTANVTYLNNKELINLLKKNFEETKEFPRLMINLDSFSKSITDKHIMNQIKLKENKLGRVLNAYEKELYKFDHMLDNYKTKFNAMPLELTENKIGEYYKTYFDTSVSKSDSIMDDYLTGLLWVFQFYFNDKKYVSTYYYKHERAPLLRHLSAYLDKLSREEFVGITNNLDIYEVKSLKKYFCPVYQLIYVSPMVPEIIALLPSNYRKEIKSKNLSPFLKKYFVDVDKIVNTLYKEPISSEIDCRSASYLNKCFMKSIHKPTKEDDEKFLHDIKQIPPSETSERRNQCRKPKY